MFIHTVYFWSVDGSESSATEIKRGCDELLSKVPSVRHLWTGLPAGTPRDVVDNSYAVGLTVVLDDSKGHDEYQVHPLHVQFVERCKKYWKKVQVYDFR